ncbi:hypothetical protein BLNAU_13760 [Blattamonas nauphoetae]|uniref:Uncharacterized protein n=1 Tax=Blattamonas nauphoetae TaxID=2049346 RepID=A0ABQ9XIW8_9EUKA|nr:hypothetical protein BLNAU_13760 [Blattamonas nauphoetae]
MDAQITRRIQDMFSTLLPRNIRTSFIRFVSVAMTLLIGLTLSLFFHQIRFKSKPFSPELRCMIQNTEYDAVILYHTNFGRDFRNESKNDILVNGSNLRPLSLSRAKFISKKTPLLQRIFYAPTIDQYLEISRIYDRDMSNLTHVDTTNSTYENSQCSLTRDGNSTCSYRTFSIFNKSIENPRPFIILHIIVHMSSREFFSSSRRSDVIEGFKEATNSTGILSQSMDYTVWKDANYLPLSQNEYIEPPQTTFQSFFKNPLGMLFKSVQGVVWGEKIKNSSLLPSFVVQIVHYFSSALWPPFKDSVLTTSFITLMALLSHRMDIRVARSTAYFTQRDRRSYPRLSALVHLILHNIVEPLFFTVFIHCIHQKYLIYLFMRPFGGDYMNLKAAPSLSSALCLMILFANTFSTAMSFIAHSETVRVLYHRFQAVFFVLYFTLHRLAANGIHPPQNLLFLIVLVINMILLQLSMGLELDLSEKDQFRLHQFDEQIPPMLLFLHMLMTHQNDNDSDDSDFDSSDVDVGRVMRGRGRGGGRGRGRGGRRGRGRGGHAPIRGQPLENQQMAANRRGGANRRLIFDDDSDSESESSPPPVFDMEEVVGRGRGRARRGGQGRGGRRGQANRGRERRGRQDDDRRSGTVEREE